MEVSDSESSMSVNEVSSSSSDEEAQFFPLSCSVRSSEQLLEDCATTQLLSKQHKLLRLQEECLKIDIAIANAKLQEQAKLLKRHQQVTEFYVISQLTSNKIVIE